VLAKCLLGLIELDAGSIEVNGQAWANRSARARDRLLRRFGVLFQNGALFDSLPIWQNVSFGLINGGRVGRDAARKMAVDALAQVGLDADAADLLPHELSGGMQKRVAAARAIIGGPEFLVLDSPTDGLDPIVTAHVDGLLRVRLKMALTTRTGHTDQTGRPICWHKSAISLMGGRGRRPRIPVTRQFSNSL
jgi:phospholipid/cholesterol/gamma-HCH transport system ATP-binding protein